MSITFKSNINIPQRLRAKTDQLVENFREAMKDAQTRIITRLDKGEGPNGKLDGYSKSYKKFKESKGRSGDLVNMRFTGNMLSSMIAETTKTPDGAKGVIKFGGSEIKKVKGNLEKRPFFGLNEDDIKRIKIRTFKK